MPLVIILRGYHPGNAPSDIGEFRWVSKHGAFVWQGRELKPDEFNAVVDEVFDRNRDLWLHPLSVRSVNRENPRKQMAQDMARARASEPPQGPAALVADSPSTQTTAQPSLSNRSAIANEPSPTAQP